MYHSEGAAGQYEVITGPLPPLQAVDALIHTRDIIFNVASKYGLRATLVPRVFGDNCMFTFQNFVRANIACVGPGGTATHTHISIHSAKKSRASSIHPTLSYIESTFLAGLLQNLFSIALLALPTTVSFKRMVDYLSAGGTYICWGTDNREAQIRLCNASDPPSRNFEIKCLDGIANPYLAVAAFISAGMDGVSRDVECQMQDCGLGPETTAANMGEENRKKLGITERMPLTWEEAESAFASSKLVDNVFGNNFKQTYVSVNKVKECIFILPSHTKCVWM
jgi:glutamine synthetase